MISRRKFLTFAGAGAVTVALDVRTLVSPGMLDPAEAAAAGFPVTAGRGLFGGLTTLDQTVVNDTPGALGYLPLKVVPGGEPHILRTDLGFFAQPTLSLGAFAQMTDLHVVDDQSPARVEFTDRLADPPNAQGFETDSAYRPHESLSTHIVEAMAQAIRNIGSGPMTGLPLAFTIVTGDMVDNLQYNEVRWYINLLDGGQTIQADSGQIGVDESVSGPFVAPGFVNHQHYYWSPDGVLQAGNLADNYRATYGFPVVPGLLTAARRPYTSTGLGMPWYAAMGNHDGEVQGNYPIHPSFLEHDVIPDISDHFTSAQKPYGSTVALQPNPSDQNIADFTNNLQYVPVTADQSRKFLVQSDFAKEHFNTSGLPRGHGFGADGTTYYAIPFNDSDLVRYIVLDTVNYDGNAGGRIKSDQYSWLESQLQANSSSYISAIDGHTMVTQSGVADKLFVIFSHHTLESMNNNTGDVVTSDSVLGFSVERLLLRYPNVILMVNGHTHANSIGFHGRFGDSPLGNQIFGVQGGFWEVNTAAHIDWPSQSRIVELAAGSYGGNGSISIFTTIVDINAPAMFGGDTSNPTALASLARQLAANDPTERLRPANSSRAGLATDRNTQLMVPAPFPLPGMPLNWGSSVALALNADGRLVLYGTNSADQIWERFEFSAGSDTWTGWVGLDGGLRAVAAEVGPDNNVMLAGINSSGMVWVRTQQSPGNVLMTGWVLLGSVDARSIALARNADGHMEVFVVVGSGDVWHIWQQGANGPWGGWSTGFGALGTASFVQIASVLNTDGRVEVFALDVAGGLWHRAEILSGGWTAWSRLTTVVNTPFVHVAAALNANGQVQVFALDNDRLMWTAWQAGVGSSTLTNFVVLDGTGPQSRMTQLAARLNGTGLIELYGIDHTGALWHRRQTAQSVGTAWSSWIGVDGILRPDVPTPPTGSTIATPPPQAVTVPNVLSFDEASAISAIQAKGLTVGTISTTNNCVDPGSVMTQNPSGGVAVPVGSAVNLTISTCTGGTGGSGGSGGTSGGAGGASGSSAGPILPK